MLGNWAATWIIFKYSSRYTKTLDIVNPAKCCSIDSSNSVPTVLLINRVQICTIIQRNKCTTTYLQKVTYFPPCWIVPKWSPKWMKWAVVAWMSQPTRLYKQTMGTLLAAHTLHMAHSMMALSPARFFGERSLFVILKEHIEYIVERSRNASTDTIVDELLKSRQTVHNCSWN